MIIIALVKTSRGSVTVYLSSNAIRKKRIFIASFFSVSFGLACLTVFLASSSLELLPLIIVGAFLFLLLGLFSFRYLTVKGFKHDWFLVRGFHKDFLREIEADKSNADLGSGL